MLRATRIGVSALAFAGVTAIVVACSTPKDDRAQSTAPSEPIADDDAGGGWVEPAKEPPTDAVCYDLARQGKGESCGDCCYLVRPRAKAVIWDTLRVCVCKKLDPSCAAECGADYCGTPLPYEAAAKNKPCLRCLERAYQGRDADCLRLVADACDGEPDCAKSTKCQTQCDAIVSALPPDAGRWDASDEGDWTP